MLGFYEIPNYQTSSMAPGIHGDLMGPTFGSFLPRSYQPHSSTDEMMPKKKEEIQNMESPMVISKLPIQHQWSPYQDNGGSCVAITGQGYALIAADTRLSSGSVIKSRNNSKLCVLTDTCVLASAGMQADRAYLHRQLHHRLQWYEYQNGGNRPGVHAISQLLATTLYYRRFFPLYAFNLLAGLDEQGNGVCFGYDAVGCTEPVRYASTGSAHTLIEPILDNQILREHQRLAGGVAQLTLEEAVTLMKDVFHSASERDIFTGDAVEMYIITSQGSKREVFPLKKD